MTVARKDLASELVADVLGKLFGLHMKLFPAVPGLRHCTPLPTPDRIALKAYRRTWIAWICIVALAWCQIATAAGTCVPIPVQSGGSSTSQTCHEQASQDVAACCLQTADQVLHVDLGAALLALPWEPESFAFTAVLQCPVVPCRERHAQTGPPPHVLGRLLI